MNPFSVELRPQLQARWVWRSHQVEAFKDQNYREILHNAIEPSTHARGQLKTVKQGPIGESEPLIRSLSLRCDDSMLMLSSHCT